MNQTVHGFKALIITNLERKPSRFGFVAIFGRGDRLTGAVAFSRPRLLMQYRRLMVDGATFPDALELSKQ